MNRQHRFLPLALIAALAAIAIAAVTAQAAALPKLLTYNGAPAKGLQVRVKSITLSADGSNVIGNGKQGLKWTSWTATGAMATGKEYINNCDPNCASGKTTAYPVMLMASRPQTVHGVLAFTRLTVTSTGKPAVKSRTLKLVYVGGSFSW